MEYDTGPQSGRLLHIIKQGAKVCENARVPVDVFMIVQEVRNVGGDADDGLAFHERKQELRECIKRGRVFGDQTAELSAGGSCGDALRDRASFLVTGSLDSDKRCRYAERSSDSSPRKVCCGRDVSLQLLHRRRVRRRI